MKLRINHRGNGACAICVFHGNCVLQKSLEESLKDHNREKEMEMVIYTCPRFKEKF